MYAVIPQGSLSPERGEGWGEGPRAKHYAASLTDGSPASAIASSASS